LEECSVDRERGPVQKPPSGVAEKGVENEQAGSWRAYVLAMAAVIVGVDVAFFRNRFWERLIVNIGIVLVFGTFYLRFLNRP
jgi:hypothetical protein